MEHRAIIYRALLAGVIVSLGMLTTQAKEPTVPRMIQFSGVLKNSSGQALVGVQGVTFALYSEQEGGAPLWIESQNVAADAEGRFSVLLGSATPGGLPVDLFSSGASRWLGVQAQVSGEPEQPRVLLVSVPYALKAADAETIGGLPASAFVLAPDAVTERVKDSGGLVAVSDGVITAQANSGGAGFIGKFFNTTDLDNSALFQLGSSIGLGTTTPESVLHLQGASTDGITVSNGLDSGVGFLRFKRADGGIAGEIRSLLGTQTLVINSNGAERIRIAPSGFVGIGTTSPIAQLHVSSPGSTRMMFQGNAGTNGVIGLDMDSTARRWTLGAQGTNENGAFILYDFTAGQRRMTVDSTGQFGIGTISPTAKLDVNGTVKATNFLGNGATLTGVVGGGGTTAFVPKFTATSTVGVSQIFDDGANIGIGTSSPTSKLHVVGGPIKADGGLAVLGDVAISGTPGVNGVMFPDGTTQTSALVGTPASLAIRGINYLVGCDSCSVLTDEDDQKTFYANKIGTMTIDSVTCYSDTNSDLPTINIQRDDGSPIDMLSPALSCDIDGNTASGGGFVGGETSLGIDQKLDFLMVSAGTTAKRVTVTIKATVQ